jgi:hypothetical protein
VTNLSIYTNDEGTFNIAATAKSNDSLVSISIDKGVKARTKDGDALKYVGIAPMTDPPAPPADTSVIGLTYDLTPAGATFDPGVTLSFTYDPAKLPAGVYENKLILAWYDSAAGKWVELGGTVDTATHTISVKVTHFTAYAVIAYTRPAAFTIGSISVSATDVMVGDSVSVSATVSNSGDLSGSYKVTLKLDGATVASTDVTVAGGGSQTVSLSAILDKAGTHTLDVNGLQEQVIATSPILPAAFRTENLVISPLEAEIGQKVDVSVVVVNTGGTEGTYRATFKIDDATVAYQDVTVPAGGQKTTTFTVMQTATGTYRIDVDGMSGFFTVREAAITPTTRANWWLIGGMIAGVVAVATVVALLVKRREA